MRLLPARGRGHLTFFAQFCSFLLLSIIEQVWSLSCLEFISVNKVIFTQLWHTETALASNNKRTNKHDKLRFTNIYVACVLVASSLNYKHTRLRAGSLFLENFGEKQAWESRDCDSDGAAAIVAQASEDERKERLHWFHTAICMLFWQVTSMTPPPCFKYDTLVSTSIAANTSRPQSRLHAYLFFVLPGPTNFQG